MNSQDDEYKVFLDADGIIYRGKHSVNQNGVRVYIDGKLVGVEVDNNGKPLAAPLPTAIIKRQGWWTKLRQRK